MKLGIFIIVIISVIWVSRGQPTNTNHHVVQNATSSRQQRQFSFPNHETSHRQSVQSQPQTIVHNGHIYEIKSSESIGRYPDSIVDGDNRQFSILPLLKGMQVGLDFRMPFFNIPIANLLSGLGGLGRPSESGITSGNLLGFGADKRALSSIAAIIITSLLFFPKILNAVGLGVENKELYRDNAQTDDLVKNVNKVLSEFNIDGDSCMQMALCSIGNAQRSQKGHTRAADTTTHIDVIESLLNLPSVKDTLNQNSNWRQAKEYGFSNGDCNIYNPLNKCPLSSDSWSQLLTNVGKAL